MHSDSPQQPGTPRPADAPSSGAYPTRPVPPPHGPYPGGFTPPPAKPSQGTRWLTHGAVGLVALFLGVGIGVSDDQAQATDSAGPAPKVTVTKEVEVPGPKVTVTKTATVTAPPPKQPKPKGPPTTVEGDGEYLVGEDMKAGTYRTSGPEGSFGCYWERARNASGEFDAIIANDNLDGSGRVTVDKGEVFKSTRCQEWKRVG
ncbi:hypothetical protein [Streptomyces griseus]|uniref:hypothetical protein n=1 Tax=Streptomyces griseus TaxID=1911 RepID=UPI0008401969|nr:hypothetical protein [Streptomyces griseus]